MNSASTTKARPVIDPSLREKLHAELKQLGLSGPIAAFFRLRRNARVVHENLEMAYQLLSMGKRTRARMEKSPFNHVRIAALNVEIADVERERDVLWGQRNILGAALIELAPFIDEITTMQERLELLNCNLADRSDLSEPDIRMMLLMGAYCVEDSAEHRGEDWNNRPLHSAVNAEMHRVMFDTPEGRVASDQMFDKLFAPGGMFEAVPRLYRLPDGTIIRQGPPVTVHDATGSRVVERIPK